MAAYPVIFDVAQQEKYDKTQVVIRLVIVIILSILSIPIGLVYLAVPAAGAILISQHGAEQYLAQAETNITKWLRLIIRLYAYIGLLTDTMPSDEAGHPVRFGVTPTAAPTAGGTLLRIILAIPHAIVLGLLGIVGGILMVIAAIMILVQQTYPEGIFNFLRGYVRWNARVLAYMAGLVDEYPPFALDTGPDQPALPAGEQPQPL